MKISSKELSIVVQGPIYDVLESGGSTNECLLQLRENFPYSQIILSTWETENVSPSLVKIVDKIVLNKDPGDETPPPAKRLNINRQILSTNAALDFVNRAFVLKTRTDILIKSEAVLQYFNQYNDSSFGKVLVYNFSFRDPRKSVKVPWWICDYIYLAKTKTIKHIYQVDLFNKDDFSYNLQKDNLRNPFANDVVSRFNPEVYLGIQLNNAVNDQKIRIKDLCEASELNVQDFVGFCARHLIVLDEVVGDVESIKGDIPFDNNYLMYSHGAWLVDSGNAGLATHMFEKIKFHSARIMRKWSQYVLQR